MKIHIFFREIVYSFLKLFYFPDLSRLLKMMNVNENPRNNKTDRVWPNVYFGGVKDIKTFHTV